MESKRATQDESKKADSRSGGGLHTCPVEAVRDASHATEHDSVASSHQVAAVADGFADVLNASIRRDIDRFIGHLENGIDFWIKAGEILVKLKKEDPDVFDVIARMHPWCSRDVLETMHGIGMQTIHPRVLLLPPKVASAVATMPYEAQKYVIENNSPVAVAREGKHTRSVPLRDMSRAEAGRVFRPTGIAKPEDQVFKKGEVLGVWELSVIGTTLHARRVSNGIQGRCLKLAGGICYVRLVK